MAATTTFTRQTVAGVMSWMQLLFAQDALESERSPAAHQETSYVPLGPSDGPQDSQGAAPLAGQVHASMPDTPVIAIVDPDQ